MKTFIGIFVSILFFASCSSEGDTLNDILDYEGTYLGIIDCTGPGADDNGEDFTTIITKSTLSDYDYDIEFEDDLIFNAKEGDRELIIEKQTFNSGLGFDEVTMVGTLSYVDEQNLEFDFSYSVDSSEEAICSTILEKQ